MSKAIPARRRAAIMVACTAVAVTWAALAASAASAADTTTTGDVVVTTYGGFFDGGGGVDKIGPAANQRSRVTTMGINSHVTGLATNRKGDLFVGNYEGRIWRVDHATGAQTNIRPGSGETIRDLAVDRDGSLVALALESSGVHLVRISATGAFTLISGSSLLSEGHSVAVEADGRMLVTSGSKLVRVDPVAGTAATLANLSGLATGLVADLDGRILVHVADGATGRIVRVDPGSGFATILSSGGVLTVHSVGLAIEADGKIVSTEFNPSDSTLSVLRIDLVTRTQALLARLGEAQANDITVAGVSQIGGSVKPTAVDDSFVINQRDITLNVPPPGALANDRDPFASKLFYRGQTQPAHGSVTEFTDGSLIYRPNIGFHGIDSWTYRANSPDGRVSAPATIQVRVDPDGTPVANNDHFTTKYQTNFSLIAPGVLANDHDPQQDQLRAKLLTGPSKGIAGISSDGQLSFLPPAHFSGDLTFSYEAIDPAGNHSKPGTVTMTVLPNAAPTLTVPDFGGLRITAGNDGLSGTFPLDVSDSESSGAVTVTGTSSNQAVVANSGIKIGPAGDTRQAVTITAKGAKGTAVVTLKASDGEKSTTLKITVMVGGSGNDTLTGTAGPDLLIGLGGQDTLSGAGGRDVLTGGAGNDTLTGGAGGDFFRGGAGTNTVTDFTGSQGDEQMETGS